MEWIVMASRAEAGIYRHTAEGSVKLLHYLENPEGQLRNREMQDDAGGMASSKFAGSAPHRLGSEKNPQEEAAKSFAKEIAKFLTKEWNREHRLSFKIVAEPKLMGMIKKELNSSPCKEHTSWLDKDLQSSPPSTWVQPLGLKKIPRNEDLNRVRS
jgi:protein required for attachment to host cells